MNPNYGYQLYQAERTQRRAEILAGDAQRVGRAAAGRRGIMVIIAGRAAGAA